MGKVIFKLAVAAMAVFMAFAALRVYYLVYPQLDSDPYYGNYNAYFSDMQNRQIRAAKAVGIKEPVATRADLDEKIAEFGLYYIDKLKTVKPTQWDTLKTEAIDFSSDFIWLDDYAMQAERNFLATKSKLNNLIIVNLNNESELKRILKLLDAPY